MSTNEINATVVPHPFACYKSTTQLNVGMFLRIEGVGPYEQYSWKEDGSDFGVDQDAGTAVDIHSTRVELYENDDSITVSLPDERRGYRYPKEFFSLTKNL